MTLYTLMVVLNMGIALGYFVLGAYVAPRAFFLPRAARMLCAAFFFGWALFFATQSIDSHALVLHIVQFVLNWTFIAFIVISGPVLRLIALLDAQKREAASALTRATNGLRA